MSSASRTVDPKQLVAHESARGRVVTMGSAYDVSELNRGLDVVLNASYSGVLPARFVARHAPRGSIGLDCGVGKDGSGIAGLWYLEALGLPAAAADVFSAELGNGTDLWESGRISYVNAPAGALGVAAGQAVREAAMLLLEGEPARKAAAAITNRTVLETAPDGGAIVCTDSIAFALPEDAERNVLCTAGHTGLSAVPYLLAARPRGFICSDGGRGRNDAGTAALAVVARQGLAGATVAAGTARLGDGLSTYLDGVISACNEPARACGVEPGQPAREAARLLLKGGP